jgi:CRISPR-associated protein Cas2
MVLIAYDVNTETTQGKRRLREISKKCEDFGQRVQNSVFECLIDFSQWPVLKHDLINIIDDKTDSLRFYFLGSNWERRIEHVGAKPTYNPEGFLSI